MRLLLPAALTVIAVTWSLVILAAPHAVHSPRLAPAVASVYAGSHRICHQRSERSFHLAGVKMPVCARCSGLYLSGAFGALLGWAWLLRLQPATIRLLVVAAALPTALTWTIEVMGLATMSNAARVLAALPLGAATGWSFVQMLRYDG